VVSAVDARFDRGWPRGSRLARVGVLFVRAWAWGGAKQAELGAAFAVVSTAEHLCYMIRSFRPLQYFDFSKRCLLLIRARFAVCGSRMWIGT
jgi:hypothetical protein